MNKIEKYKIARAVVASHTHACVREGECVCEREWVCVWERVSVCERESECAFACGSVCVWTFSTEHEHTLRSYEHMRVRERVCVWEWVWVSVRQRESERDQFCIVNARVFATRWSRMCSLYWEVSAPVYLFCKLPISILKMWNVRLLQYIYCVS